MWACSYSMGGTMPIAERWRCWLYQVWTHSDVSCRAWALVAQVHRLMSLRWRVEKNDSAGALSKALPVRPMDGWIPRRRQAFANPAYDPLPQWKMTPAMSPPRTATAMLIAYLASSAVGWRSVEAKSTMCREQRSSTAAKNIWPSAVAISLKSPHQFWLTPVALKSRFDKSVGAVRPAFWLVRPFFRLGRAHRPWGPSRPPLSSSTPTFRCSAVALSLWTTRRCPWTGRTPASPPSSTALNTSTSAGTSRGTTSDEPA